MENIYIVILVIVCVTIYLVGGGNKFEYMGGEAVDDYLSEVPIFIINLKARRERKRLAVREMRKHNISAEVVNGIDGNSLDRGELIRHGLIDDETGYRKLRKGEIGCYFSHLRCWELIWRTGKEYGIVLEDDVVLDDNFRGKFNRLLSDLEGVRWDYICLGRRCNRRWFNDRDCDHGKEIVKNIYYPSLMGYATFAYVIKRDVIKRLMKGTFPIAKPVDVVVLEENDKGEIKSVILGRDLIRVRNIEDSDTVKIK
ncbi:MAG: glycosyltransferase family 25 [Hyperionvirus sp.]|uniref:Glycosyltransferase family 25 n=1 Tax=Hyperionvirus sp. TaxID=2487770 RepID=A0A3G5AF47_9VIRU|nr:MAG: glycosyltransferase family 25 [Hyperionvirus sp.]